MFDGALRTVADYEHACRQRIAPGMFEFLYGQRGDPEWSTYTSNRAGLDALKLRPRVLTGVEHPQLETTLLGQELSFPVIAGPVGVVPGDPSGEVETARATLKAGTLTALSAIPTHRVEDVAAAAEGRWLQQVFLYRDRSLTERQVKLGAELGAKAIVLTVSCTGAIDYHQILRFPPIFPAGPTLDESPPDDDPSGVDVDPSVNWSDVDWLRSLTPLPLVIKGIQTAEDALLCVEHGVDGIVISNHGGRFAQGVRGTIEALPEIVAAVDGKLEVSIDGGIRQGQDILKSLALGARTVWIGRAARWGRTVGGEDGVANVLQILRDELRGMMALCGVADVKRVPAGLVTAAAVPSAES